MSDAIIKVASLVQTLELMGAWGMAENMRKVLVQMIEDERIAIK